MSLRLDGVKREVMVVRRNAGLVVIVAGRNHVLGYIDPLAAPHRETISDNLVTAPLPARVTRVLVEAGDEVKRGAPLATLEAMKMELTLTAPRAGVIAEVLSAVGDTVEQGAAVVVFEGDES
jgi:3-methylcrotonyl-CoA carboxylase alpha subunit